jgi:surface protein
MIEYAGKTFVKSRKVRKHYIKTLIKNNITPELMPFITVWKTDSSDNTITLPVNTKYDYNYTVDWGDGNIDKNIADSKTHTYSTTGKHTVKVSGDFPHLQVQDKKQLQLVTQWGDVAWKDFTSSFAQCSNFDVIATDTPDLINVNSTANMFKSATKLKGNKYFNDWDFSSVTNMDGMFSYTNIFNQPLNNWDVSKVTNMRNVFNEAFAFNQALNNWDVSNVTDMLLMFAGTKAFNQALNNWDVSNVTNMLGMFLETEVFNQPLNDWDVSNVTNLNGMFEIAKVFNQPLNKWKVGSVTDMKLVFRKAHAFNQPLNDWDVSSVTSMAEMFRDAKVFNQPLNNWNVSNVTSMDAMLYGTSAFTNQDLSSWNVGNVPSGNHNAFVYGSGGRNTEPNWNP